MRRLRYSVATSLDGFISTSNNESDWIIIDDSVDFESFFKKFDTVLMGRKTFEVSQKGNGVILPGMQTIVCSKAMTDEHLPNITISNDAGETVKNLKEKSGKDIWLFGGGELFRSLLDDRLVDTIEIAVMPILLSQGAPLLPAGDRSPQLLLMDSKILPNGTASLTYQINY